MCTHMDSQKLLLSWPPAVLGGAAARFNLEDVKREQQLVRQHFQRVLYEPPGPQKTPQQSLTAVDTTLTCQSLHLDYCKGQQMSSLLSHER